MEAKITTLAEKKLVGMSVQMSYLENKTFELWHRFMSQRRTIPQIVGKQRYSLQVYPDVFSYKDFHPAMVFTKYALVEVPSFENTPIGMIPYLLKGGLYAVFIHKGLARDFQTTFKHIFEHWLPNSNYSLDQREHFEVLPEGYQPQDPKAKEEVWVPIKGRTDPN